jgi:hypothetical protein
MKLLSFIKERPSAWVPLLMSGVAFGLLVTYVLFLGVNRSPTGDEGAAARIFQLLLAGQIPVIIYFAFKNFRKNFNETALVLFLQVLAGVLAIVSIFLLENK